MSKTLPYGRGSDGVANKFNIVNKPIRAAIVSEWFRELSTQSWSDFVPGFKIMETAASVRYFAGFCSFLICWTIWPAVRSNVSGADPLRLWNPDHITARDFRSTRK